MDHTELPPSLLAVVRDMLAPGVHVSASLIADGRTALAAYDAAHKPQISLWSYDGRARRLRDENGLTVAENVAPADADEILALVTPGNAFDKGYESGFRDGHTEGVAVLLQPAKAACAVVESQIARPGAERTRDACDALKVAIRNAEETDPGAEVSPELGAVLGEMLAWHAADAFDGDEEVNGGDMVEAFSEWRTQIRQALASRRVGTLPDVSAPQFSADDIELIGEALDRAIDQISGEAAEEHARGMAEESEEHDEEADAMRALLDRLGGMRAATLPDVSAVGLLRKLRAECVDWQDALSGEREGFDALCAEVDSALANGPTPVKIGVELRDGCVQDVWSDAPLPGAQLILYDFDTEGSERADVSVVRWPQRDGTTEPETVIESEWDFADDVRPMPPVEDSMSPEFDVFWEG